MIKVKNLVKKYDNFKALDNLSFNIKKGEVVGFLGPNGAGKTTTMKILTCYMPPSSGDVKIAGLNTLDENYEIRKKIGYLPESAPLYLDMEVSAYLKFIAKMRGLKSNDLDKKYNRVIDICGLGEKVRMPIATLSKGYRQRVGLAQALINEPEILILDEPTSGLDPHQIIEIRELIKDIGKEKTVLLSTHILPEVSATCNRVMIINKGKIAAEGTPDELVASSHGEEVIIAKIEGAKTTVQKSLLAIPSISAVEIINEEKAKLFEYKITGEKKVKKDLRKEIFNTVVKKKYSLLEMRMESLSLEDIFINLTNVEETDITN